MYNPNPSFRAAGNAAYVVQPQHPGQAPGPHIPNPHLQTAQTFQHQPTMQSAQTSITPNAPFFAPGSEQYLPQWFQSVDADRSGQISVAELQRVLQQNGLAYSMKFCASLIRMLDQTRTGSLNYQEFCQVHQFLNQAKSQFTQFDRNRSGTLSTVDVHAALTQQGFQLDNEAVNRACAAFDISRSGQFSLDYFIAMMVFLTNAKTIFEAFDTDRSGQVTFDFSRFVYASSSCT